MYSTDVAGLRGISLRLGYSRKFVSHQCLPLHTWTLLEFDHLFVSEETAVVDQSHGVECLAVGTDSRLCNPSSVYLHRLGLLAHIAPEESW